MKPFRSLSFTAFFLLSFFCMALSGCSGTDFKETIGLGRRSPDEFRVLSRPPLSVPPEFTLRPPTPGEDGGAATTPPRSQAESLVLGTNPEANQTLEEKAAAATAPTAVQPVTSGSLPTTAESRFLSNIGATKADPEVRQKIREERLTTQEEEPDFIDRLRGNTEKEPTVNAAGEAERIKQNKESGKPVTEGETPTQDPKKEGVLQRLLN